MDQPVCASHTDTLATGSCQECLRTLCSLCLTVDRSLLLCLLCARRVRRRRAILLGTIGVLALGGAGALVAFSPKRESASGNAAGEFAKSMVGHGAQPTVSAVEAIEHRLVTEPCDRQSMFSLDEALGHAGDYRGVIDRTEAFWKRCGPLSRLRWFTYDAHKRLSEIDKAIADAALLIAENPHDKDFWWWRGILYEETGQIEKAAADFRQSITIEPRIAGIPFNLAAAYEKLGKPCDAIFPIEQFLRYHPDVIDRESVDQRLFRLYAEPGCAPMVGKGRAVIRFQPGDAAIHATVKMGRVSGVFIVDTGASLTVLTSELAEKVGLHPSSKILIHTAAGIAEGLVSIVDSMDVQGVHAKYVPVAVLDQLPPGVDGLLGLSFLARFNIQMETQAGRLTLSTRAR